LVIDNFAQADFRGAAAALPAPHADDSFNIVCPGGAAVPNAGTATRAACDATLVRATRRGILVTLMLFGWAAIHYFLASIGIAKALRAASLRNGAAGAAAR